MIAAEFAKHGGAMIVVRNRCAYYDAALILSQVFMRESPSPLAVGDADACASPPGDRPGISRINARWSGIEIDLSG